MAIDDKLAYLSTWDIDQLVTANTTVGGTGDTTLYTLPANTTLPALPVFQVQFQPSGSSQWYNCGTNSTNGTLGSSFTFFAYFSGSSLTINTSSGGTARYFIWSDKVNY